MNLTYVKPSGDTSTTEKYTGLDRCNRVVDQRWAKNASTTPQDVERYKYTYDANGNVLSKINAIDSAKTETYSYDNLNQLTGFARGGGAPTPTYTLDGMGNFLAVATGSAATSQTRSTNSQNEISSITTGTGAGATTVALTYDANGNMTKDETGALLTYDSWNRLVKVVKDSTTVTYSYDTLGRRVTESVNGSTKDLYYSKDWQVIEERVGGVAKTQYVWSPVYVDAMIERDRDVNGGSDGLEQRLWPLQDANFNTTALVDSNGTVTERYVYDPYGKVTVLAPDGTMTRTNSNVDWVYLHQGGRLDPTTGLYNFRNRDYSPTLMRWTTNDPLGFGGGDTNTYRYGENGPTGALDPTGLAVSSDDGRAGGYLKSVGTTVVVNAPGVVVGIGVGMGLLAVAVAAPPVVAFLPACVLGIATYRGFKAIEKNIFESITGTDAETMKPLSAKELGERHGNFILNAAAIFTMFKYRIQIANIQAKLNVGIKTLSTYIPEKFWGPAQAPKNGPVITDAKNAPVAKGKTNWLPELLRRAKTEAENLGAHYRRNYATYVGVVTKDGVVKAYNSTPNQPAIARGKHAEVRAYEELKASGKCDDPASLRFTQPYGWRIREGDKAVWTPQPICKECQAIFSKKQFPENVLYERGGPWDAADAAALRKIPPALRPAMGPGEKDKDE